jgi:3-deoxy-D-manno-octulosonic-acid transferase
MYLLYSLMLVVWSILLFPLFIYKTCRRHTGFTGVGERLGRLPETLRFDGRKTIWFHACSVGETLSLQPLVQALERHFPGTRFVFSTTTSTGQALAVERFARYGKDNAFYFPVDLASIVGRVLDHVRPAMIIIVDTEIWPNLLHQAQSRNIPVLMANGRISGTSFRYYRWGRFFFRRVLRQYSALLMQSREDADRILAMGAPKDRTEISGNMKFDGDVFEGRTGADFAQNLELTLGPDSQKTPLIIAGSTHPPEEKILLDVLKGVRQTPGLENTRLLLAPRHPERFDAVAQLAARNGFAVKRRSSESDTDHDAPVILLDTVGELATAYRYATVAFIGGTLISHGGHSILEPALCSKPVVVGPSMENFQSVFDEFLSCGGILQIKADWEERELQVRQLQAAFLELLQDPRMQRALGTAARAVLDRNRGAVLRTVRKIESLFETTGK